jgi:hypothetical protein
MRALLVALGICVAAACGAESDDGTASNESGGAGGKSAGGGSGAGATSGTGGGAGGSAGSSSDGAAGDSGGSAGLAGGGGSPSGGSSGGGGASGGGGCTSETREAATVVNDPSVGYQGWTNPSYAKSSDDLRATSPTLPPTRATQRLVASAFGFQIPTTASIQGIEVAVERSKGGLGTARDSAIRVVKAGATAPSNPITTVAWPATDATVTYGGPTSLWGATWSPADISAASFGVFIRAQNAHATENVNPRVDSLKVTVHFCP